MNSMVSRLLPDLGVLIVCAAYFVSIPAVMADDHTNLVGPAFSDSDHQAKMTDAWHKQGIRYEHWAKDADIAMSLDQQLYPALASIVREYALQAGIKLAVNKGTCGVSAGMLSKKTVDIAGFCCPPGLTDRLPDVEFHTLGIASIGLLVHPTNPTKNVTADQAREIFAGEIRRWSELEGSSGSSMPIQTVGRLHCKARPGHWRLLLDNEDMFSSTLQEVGAIPDMLSHVSAVKHAIGFETLWMVNYHGHQDKVSVISIDGVHPGDSQKLLAGKYPMYRTYSLAIWTQSKLKNPHVAKIAAFLKHQIEINGHKYGIIPASRLRKAGWKFKGNELVGQK